MSPIRLALLAFPTLALGFALAPARQEEPKASKAVKVEVAVPKGVAAFVSVNVAEVWEHPAFFPIRGARGQLEFAWAVQSVLGVTPTQIDRITAFWPASHTDSPYLLIRGRKPLDPVAMVKILTRPGAKESKPREEKVLAAPGAEFPFLVPVDEKTVLLAPKSADVRTLKKLAADAVAALAKAGGDHSLAVAIDVKAIVGRPLPFGGPLLEARTATLTADLGEQTGLVKFSADFATAAAAKEAEPILRAKLMELAGWAKAQQKRAEERVGAGNSYTAPLLEWISSTLRNAKVRTEGANLIANSEVKIEELVSRVMMAVPDSALAPRGASAAENNLKQIGLAIHNYHDANGQCPGNSYDKDGKPLLSWRVHILPYIEQQALYMQFKLDETWDSPNNKTISQTVIRTYQVPGRSAKQPWETYFRTFIGPKNVKSEYRPWLTEGNSKGPKLTEVTDGTSNTIMVIEAGEAVPWAKPDDLSYDGLMALPKFGGPGGTFVALFGDGSVRTFRRGQINEVNLRGIISIQGGEVVNIPGR
jgi:hypothetical protein